MKALIIILLAATPFMSAHAKTTKPSSIERCMAVYTAVDNLTDLYITKDLSCQIDADCTTVLTISKMCEGRIVNKSGEAGHELLIKSTSYKELVKALDSLPCPRPDCAAIKGKIKCSAKTCKVVPGP